ncbi:MAG: methyltransferase domain-containing protein [Chloroflexi bacterium]|nr:methyltransferase domain-containing protein [Chloroflexota bacterium]
MPIRKITEFDASFFNQYMMGPNAVMQVQELLEGASLQPGMRVLDLGCGKGLTSIYLAQEYGARVFAVDLWISAAENLRLFSTFGLEDQIIPLQIDAAGQLPFADGYFDALVSVDSYQYYGSSSTYFDTHIARLLKPNALIAIAIPGMHFEISEEIPEEMKPYWPLEAVRSWHSIPWWQAALTTSSAFQLESIAEMDCFDAAWQNWMACDNPHAVQDRDVMRMDNGRYMNLIAIRGRKRG